MSALSTYILLLSLLSIIKEAANCVGKYVDINN